MSDEQKRPKVGDVVIRRGAIVKDDHSDNSFRVRWDDGDFGWHLAGNVVKMINHPPAAPRQPWETLREAAEIMATRGYCGPAFDMRVAADAAELEAAPPADPPKKDTFDEGLWWWSFQRREPWEVLISAANLLDQHGHKDARRVAVALADRLYGAANPPDPVELLRQIAARHGPSACTDQLMRRVVDCIAAHDANKDTSR